MYTACAAATRGLLPMTAQNVEEHKGRTNMHTVVYAYAITGYIHWVYTTNDRFKTGALLLCDRTVPALIKPYEGTQTV